LTDLTGELEEGDYFTEALAALGPEMPELEHGLVNAVPEGVVLNSLSVDPAQVGAAMNQAFVAGAGGLLADMTMLNQLIYAVTQGDLVEATVEFTADGQPVTAFGSEGLDLTEPVDRQSFIDELALIFLTEPLREVEGSYSVTGMANVFEAALMVQILDGSGEVVHEVPVTADCGTGCWGRFTVEIDADLITPGESSVRVFAHSPEDGSMIDVITVPIPAGDVWKITVGD
jgi:hypothetical protein